MDWSSRSCRARCATEPEVVAAEEKSPRRNSIRRETFSYTPEYYHFGGEEADPRTNYYEIGLQNSRLEVDSAFFDNSDRRRIRTRFLPHHLHTQPISPNHELLDRR